MSRLRTLYDSTAELDACGVGFVADARGHASQEILDLALEALCRVRHRGAVAADRRTGDGAGVLLPIPSSLLPGPWCGLAMVFLRDDAARHRVEAACAAEGIEAFGWRPVPVQPFALGDSAVASAPRIEQLVLRRPFGVTVEEAERSAWRARKRVERTTGAYVCSVLQNGHVQGTVRRRPTRRVLPRPARSDPRSPVRTVPPAVLDQHHSVLGARSAVSPARP